MVLHKSNSMFNTGATQRLCNNLGAFIQKPNVWDYDIMDYEPCTLNIVLEGTTNKRNQQIYTPELGKALVGHEQALKKLYDYLGFPGPGLEAFYREHSHDYYYNNYRDYSYTMTRTRCFSLSNRNLWFVRDRIDNLMLEKDFWGDEEKGIVDILVRKISTVPRRCRLQRKVSSAVVFRAKELSLEQKEDKEKRVNEHARGVQRSHLLHSKRKRSRDSHKTDENKNPMRIVVELEETQVDARGLNSPGKSQTDWEYRGREKKSLFKSKDCWNGKYCLKKGYRRLHIQSKKDILEDLDTTDNCDHRLISEYYKNTDCESFDTAISENRREPCIQDWVAVAVNKKRRNKSKIVKNKKQISSIEPIEDFINTASSQFTIKHAKGSYQFIDKPHDVEIKPSASLHTDILSPVQSLIVSLQHFLALPRGLFPSIFPSITVFNTVLCLLMSPKYLIFRVFTVLTSSVSFPMISNTVLSGEKDAQTSSEEIDHAIRTDSNLKFDDFDIERLFIENPYTDENKGDDEERKKESPSIPDIHNNSEVEENAQLALFEHCDKFVEIKLHPREDFHNLLTASDGVRKGSSGIRINGCSVILGNCIPPVFSVKLQAGNTRQKTTWSLVVASSSNGEFIWETTLKNSEPSEFDSFAKEAFYSELCTMGSDFITLDHLIGSALNHISFSGCEEAKLVNSNISRGKDSKNPTPGSRYNYPVINVLSVEDALKKADVINSSATASKGDHKHATTTTSSASTQIPNEIVECGVCFDSCETFGRKHSGAIALLPCLHYFCHGCWEAHISYSLSTGDHEIRCMDTGCNEILNEAMLDLMLPEKSMNKLCWQRKERLIDVSPLCQWCPKSKCDKVAVISNDCLSWIQKFGCPVSCDCNNSWCFSCQGEPHWPASCGQSIVYKKLLSKVEQDMPSAGVDFGVELKPCPGCRYPIEKSYGCPHMVCHMCRTDFCWNCLDTSDTHCYYSCEVDEDANFTTYQLRNDLSDSFPIQFFSHAIEIRKTRKEMIKSKPWEVFNKIQFVLSRMKYLPFTISARVDNIEMTKDTAIRLVKEAIAFIDDAYGFLENFYLLLSFAFLNEKTSKCKNRLYLNSVHRMSNRVSFIASQLERLVFTEDIKGIIRDENTLQMYLAHGRETMEELSGKVKGLWKLSRDVPTKVYEDLDPNEYYRYQ